MSDKPLAGLLAAIAVAPLCLVCVLGPPALVAAGGWFIAWLGGFGMPLIASALAVGGWLVWRAIQRRSAAREVPAARSTRTNMTSAARSSASPEADATAQDTIARRAQKGGGDS